MNSDSQISSFDSTWISDSSISLIAFLVYSSSQFNLIISAQKTGIIDPLFFIPIHWQDLPICLSVFLWIQPLLYILAQTFRISERTTEIESLFIWLGTSNPHCHQLPKMTCDYNSSFLKILRRVSNGEKSNLFSKSLWAIYTACSIDSNNKYQLLAIHHTTFFFFLINFLCLGIAFIYLLLGQLILNIPQLSHSRNLSHNFLSLCPHRIILCILLLTSVL